MMLPTPNDGFRWIDTEYGPALVCTALEPFAPHLFTTRRWTLGSAAAGDVNAWDEVAHAMGVSRGRLVRLHQVHGAAVTVVRTGELRDVNHLPDADIVMTDDPSLTLAVQTADCVALLIADRRGGAVAAAHAGWRGLAARAPAEAVEMYGHVFDSAPADLIVAAGPSIGPARYEVGHDVRERFVAAGFADRQITRWFTAGSRPDHWRFDLWQSSRDQLEAAGVRSDRIFVAGLCTSEHADVLCSYRRDWKDAGRMAAAIRARS